MAIQIISGITIILCLYYGYIVLNLLKGWKQLPSHVISNEPIFKTSVSVLIAARNEERNIAKTIDSILKQHYPSELMEVIIVNDHSTDGTADIIASYGNQGVKLIELNEHEKLNSYKKKAISKAIANAKGELMVATDADCVMGPNWLCAIVSLYEEKNYKLISSPVIYHEEKSYFEKLQTLEFLYLIGLGAASIGLRKPSTCNGANLAYRRDVFYELGGFNGIDDLASGDDELFLHRVAQKYPLSIGFCKSRDAIVYTEAKENLQEFIRQRRRWASKSTKYKNKKIVLLGVAIWIFNLAILVSALLGIFFPSLFVCFGFVLLAKILIELLFLMPITTFASRSHLLVGLPLLSFLHLFYIIYIGIAGNTGKYYWKGRKVK
ncbi:glycosyltransferase [Olivibacter sp. CPCC 100613]|uniref:glycosyltransferase family 2 protein n=1 Tax=Olivibacter sp. CPCC 100613 TaxID=3079931 RepID=UPI002FF4E097